MPKRISFNELDAAHIYEWLQMYWQDEARKSGNTTIPYRFQCLNIGRRLSRMIGAKEARRIRRVVAKNSGTQ